MHLFDPGICYNLVVFTVGLHLGYLWLVDAGLNVVAEVANVKHFLSRVPKIRMFYCVFESLDVLTALVC